MPDLAPSQMRERVGVARVARLATVGAHGRPHLVPVCFAIDGDILYSSTDQKPKTTMRLRRLRNIQSDPRVTVLVDHYEEDWPALWWVRIEGDARMLHDGDERDRGLRMLKQKYPQYVHEPPQGVVLAVEARHWVGWSYS